MSFIKKDDLKRLEKSHNICDVFLIVFCDINTEKKFYEKYPQYVYKKNIETVNNTWFIVPKNKLEDILSKGKEEFNIDIYDFVKVYNINENFYTIEDFINTISVEKNNITDFLSYAYIVHFNNIHEDISFIDQIIFYMKSKKSA